MSYNLNISSQKWKEYENYKKDDIKVRWVKNHWINSVGNINTFSKTANFCSKWIPFFSYIHSKIYSIDIHKTFKNLQIELDKAPNNQILDACLLIKVFGQQHSGQRNRLTADELAKLEQMISDLRGRIAASQGSIPAPSPKPNIVPIPRDRSAVSPRHFEGGIPPSTVETPPTQSTEEEIPPSTEETPPTQSVEEKIPSLPLEAPSTQPTVATPWWNKKKEPEELKEFMQVIVSHLKRERLQIPDSLPDYVSFRLQRFLDRKFLQTKSIERLEDSLSKENIEDLQYLEKRWKFKLDRLFTEATQSLFRNAPVSTDQEIVLCGNICKDGLGDFYHLVNAARILKEAFPSQKISLVMDFKEYKSRQSKIQLPQEFECIVYDSEKDSPNSDLVAKGREKLAKAHLIVNLPDKYPLELISEAKKKNPECKKPIRFMEYGYGDDSYSRNWGDKATVAMGVNPSEVGIVIKPQLSEGLLNLENGALIKLLMGKEAPSIADERSYIDATSRCFCYARKEGVVQFIRIACAAYAEDAKPLDIVCPFDDSYYLYLKNIPNENPEIAKIQFYKKTPEGKIELIKESAREGAGKTVRIIDPFPLTEHDFQIFASKADFMGCTGDISFTEAVSYGKTFFYNAPEHKADFIESLADFAEERFGEDSLLAVCFKIMSELDFMDLNGDEISQFGKLLRNPKTREETRLFCEEIRKYYNFNEHLIDRVSRDSFLQLHPDIGILEKSLRKDFKEGRKTLQEAFQELKSVLEKSI